MTLIANVEVSVFDRLRDPVHGLNRDGFLLFEEGQERAILAFGEVKPEASEKPDIPG